MSVILRITIPAIVGLFSATSPKPAMAENSPTPKSHLTELSEVAAAEIARQTLPPITAKHASPSYSLDVIRVSREKHVMNKGSFSCQPAGPRPLRSLVSALYRSYQLDSTEFNWTKILKLNQLESLLADQKAEVCEGSFLEEGAGSSEEVLGYLHMFYLRGLWGRVLVPVGVRFEWGG